MTSRHAGLRDDQEARLPSIRRPAGTLSSNVLSVLRDAIVGSALPPGTRLTEAALARQLGVSKTPVREALLRLVASGLVESDASGQLRVIGRSADRIADAYEMRLILELAAVRHAAERATADDCKELRDTAEESVRRAKAGDLQMFLSIDCDFHGLIGEISGNRLLRRTLADILYLVSTLRLRDAPDVSSMHNCSLQHLEIADAVTAGMAEDAVRLMRAHIESVATKVLGARIGRSRIG